MGPWKVKNIVARVVLPHCRCRAAASFSHFQVICSRRMTTSPGAHSNDATAAGNVMLAELDPKMLEILVCPFTKEPLTYDREARELLSPMGIAFPVTASGIPNMIPASARMISQD